MSLETLTIQASTSPIEYGFIESANTLPVSVEKNSVISSQGCTPRSKLEDSIRSEIGQAGSVAEALQAHLGLADNSRLIDRAPTIAEGYLAASKPVKKDPPPKATARLKHRNPIADLKPGEALECPAVGAGITYGAAERRVGGILQYYKNRKGWAYTTRREAGSLWVYRTA